MKNYKHSTPDMDTLENNSFAKKGLQFINAMNEYNETRTFPLKFMEDVLDKLHIRDGYVMDVLEYGDSYGRKCRFYAHKAATKGIFKGDYEKGCRQTKNLFNSLFGDGPQMNSDYSVKEYSEDMLIDGYLAKTTESKIPDVQEYLSFIFSEETVWQMYLIDIAKTVLPLFWHNNYIRRTFFFDKQSLLNFHHKEVASFVDSKDIVPTVKIIDYDTMVVKCCFWNDWKGLCVEEVTAERSDGRITFIRDDSRLKILFPYDCGIMF